jgi:hypothetical protein
MTRRQPRSPRASPRLIRDRRTSAPTWGRGRASGQARRTAPLPRNADHGRRGDDGQTLAAEHLPEEDGERGKQDRRQHKAVPEKLEMNPALKRLKSEPREVSWQAPGTVSGFWMADMAGATLNVMVFESEDAARSALEPVRTAPRPPWMQVERADVYEVLAHF